MTVAMKGYSHGYPFMEIRELYVANFIYLPCSL